MNKRRGMDLNLLSLFSGGGFLDIGFLNEGYTINQSIEINPQFIKAYNFGIWNYIETSACLGIEDKLSLCSIIESPIDASDPSMQNLLKKKNEGITGIIGGPPCQDYSVGGKNAGITGEKGKLILSYLEIVSKVKPKFVFFENVAGLYNTKSHQPAFLELVSELRKLEYEVWFDILNCLNYGVPQDRPRLTLVGFDKNIVKALENAGYKKQCSGLEWSDEYIFNWPKKLFNSPKTAIKWPTKWKFGSEILHEEVNNIPKEYFQLMVKTAFEGITSETHNQNEHFSPISNKFKVVCEGDTNRKSFKRLHRYKYSPTVAYGNNEVHLHPTEGRRLSVREALRLQSVPDEYVLPQNMPLSQKFKLISNGVPVKKAELIAAEIKRTLINYYNVM